MLFRSIVEPVDPSPESVATEPEPAPAAAAATPEDPDAEFDQAVEAQSVGIPTGERLVPLSAVTRLRERLRTAKADGEDAATLRAKLAEVEAQKRELEPLAGAFRAIQQASAQAQPPQPAAPAQPSPADVAALEDLAKDLDFYRPDGHLDLDRAKRHQDRIRREIGRAHV